MGRPAPLRHRDPLFVVLVVEGEQRQVLAVRLLGVRRGGMHAARIIEEAVGTNDLSKLSDEQIYEAMKLLLMQNVLRRWIAITGEDTQAI